MANCDKRRNLRGAIGWLECHRETGHPGLCRDNSERIYWLPAAELEHIELPIPESIDGLCLSCLGTCDEGYHCCDNCEHALRQRGEWVTPENGEQ